MHVKKINTVILGAGVAGLGAALKCRELNIQYEIFEANSTAGGLLDNFTVEGFRFDNAVHLSFANEEKVRSIFDKTPYYVHSPDALNFEKDKWLKHPVPNNLYPLDANEKAELIESFIQRNLNASIENYNDWLVNQYGLKIAERYPIKYTRKYWGKEACELSTTWIGNRVKKVELSEVLYGAMTNDTPNTYYAKEMRYPKEGGFKSFIQPLIMASRINFDYKAIKIITSEKKIYFNNGSCVHYEKLVSSLPLPVLISLLSDPVSEKIKNAAAELEATSIDLISVAFNKNIINKLWFYIYDEDIFASRAYSPSVKSSDNVPENCSSLQFEIYNPDRMSKYTVQELKDNVYYALEKMGIGKKEDVIFMHHKHLEWGNVVFKHDMEKHRSIIREYLEEINIKSIGRFGEWDYLWSNQSLLSGYNYNAQN